MIDVGRHPRVALDVHMVGTHETGNETYATELALALGRTGECETLLYTPNPGSFPERPVTGRIRKTPGVPSAIRLSLIYPWLAFRDNVDLLHVTYVAPPMMSRPTVVTVHDVSYRIFPRFFSPRVRFTLELLVGRSVRRAARVIAISQNTKHDLTRFYGIDPGKIVVTPLAASARFRRQAADQVAEVRRRLRLPARYVLAVGNLQPRKNLGRLLDAFEVIAPDYADLALVLVGQSKWGGADIEDRVRGLTARGRIVMAGHVAERDLPAIYAGSDVFCYPSLYEGFGLPVVEAMACGAPTLTGDNSSLPEVAADAALAVDVTSVAAIVRGLRRLLDCPELRTRLIRAGEERARLFTWDMTARRTIDVYRSVIESR